MDGSDLLEAEAASHVQWPMPPPLLLLLPPLCYGCCCCCCCCCCCSRGHITTTLYINTRTHNTISMVDQSRQPRILPSLHPPWTFTNTCDITYVDTNTIFSGSYEHPSKDFTTQARCFGSIGRRNHHTPWLVAEPRVFMVSSTRHYSNVMQNNHSPSSASPD